MAETTLRVNGETHRLNVVDHATLLDTLREALALTGTKKGCDRGECGTCTVHIDGRSTLSCLTLAVMAEGKEITMSAVACIREGHARSDDDIREFMSGNLCRCSAYPQIVAAVRACATVVGI